PLHGQGGDIESGAVQLFDIVAELAKAQLRSLQNFTIEIIRRLGKFRQRADRELLILVDGAVAEIAYPAGFENPNILRVAPLRLIGEYPPLDVKGTRLQFEHGEPGEE